MNINSGIDGKISGIVYLHRISDTRVSQVSRQNLRMFKAICGPDALRNVVIVTTFWDKVAPEEGIEKELELRTTDNLFKQLTDGGATYTRHDGELTTASSILGYLLPKATVTPKILEEINQGKPLIDTTAGTILNEQFAAMNEKHQADLNDCKANMETLDVGTMLRTSVYWSKRNERCRRFLTR